jgi:AAA domain-containing protein
MPESSLRVLTASKQALAAAAQCSAVTALLSDITPQAVSWLWPARIPLGKLTLLEGDPGLGKSTLALDLAARVSCGAVMPDGVPGLGAPSGVVVLTAEDGLADTVAPRLEAAGADRERIVALCGVRVDDYERPPMLPEDLPGVRAAIEQVVARLVIIDPLVAFFGSSVDSWRDQDVRRALHPLAQLAEECDVAILALRHLTKGGGPQAIYRGGGSIGIVGAARSALLVARDPEDDGVRVLASVKCNLAPEPPSLTFRLESAPGSVARIVWGGSSPHRADALVAVPADEGERSSIDEAIGFLREELSATPQKSRELERAARRLGISDRTLERARARLGVRPQKVGGEWWVSLPSGNGGGSHLPALAVLANFPEAPTTAGVSPRPPRPPAGEDGSLGENGVAIERTAIQAEGEA